MNRLPWALLSLLLSGEIILDYLSRPSVIMGPLELEAGKVWEGQIIIGLGDGGGHMRRNGGVFQEQREAPSKETGSSNLSCKELSSSNNEWSWKRISSLRNTELASTLILVKWGSEQIIWLSYVGLLMYRNWEWIGAVLSSYICGNLLDSNS